LKTVITTEARGVECIVFSAKQGLDCGPR